MFNFLLKDGRHFYAVVGIWVLACVLFLGIRSYEEPLTYGPHGRIFADNDGSMRWLLVHRALQGEGTRIRWMHEDNAPIGRINEWTSPLTLIGAWSTRIVEILSGMNLKEAWGYTGVWMAAWMGLAIMAVGALYAWWMGKSWSLAAVWLLALQPLPDWIQMTRLGNPDYHSLHQLLLVVMFLSTYRAVGQLRGSSFHRKDVARHGVLVGLASAIAIWSGATECMVWVALIYGLGIYEFWLEPLIPFIQQRRKQIQLESAKKKKQTIKEGNQTHPTVKSPWDLPVVEVRYFWLVSVRVFAAVLLIAQLYEYWPKVWTTQLEMLSPWHVAAGIMLWLCFELRSRSTSTAVALGAPVVSIVLLIVFAGWLRDWRWNDLHVAQSNYYWLSWSAAMEMQGWWHGEAALVNLLKRLWWCYGLLIPLFIVVGWKYIRSGKVAIWAGLVVAALFYLSLNQARWGSFFVIAFVLVLGLALNQAWPKILHWHGVFALALCFPCWQTVYSGIIKNQSVKGRYEEANLMQKASEIITQDAGRRGTIVLAPWHLTPRMICHGQVRTIGSAYWSNMEGLKVSHEIYSTWSEERLRVLLKEREVDYFLAPPPPWMAKEVYEATLVLTQRKLSHESLQNAAIVQALIKEADYLEPLSDLAKGWRVFRINRSKL